MSNEPSVVLDLLQRAHHDPSGRAAASLHLGEHVNAWQQEQFTPTDDSTNSDSVPAAVHVIEPLWNLNALRRAGASVVTTSHTDPVPVSPSPSPARCGHSQANGLLPCNPYSAEVIVPGATHFDGLAEIDALVLPMMSISVAKQTEAAFITGEGHDDQRGLQSYRVDCDGFDQLDRAVNDLSDWTASEQPDCPNLRWVVHPEWYQRATAATAKHDGHGRLLPRLLGYDVDLSEHLKCVYDDCPHVHGVLGNFSDAYLMRIRDEAELTCRPHPDGDDYWIIELTVWAGGATINPAALLGVWVEYNPEE